jgi:hypothetical protein
LSAIRAALHATVESAELSALTPALNSTDRKPQCAAHKHTHDEFPHVAAFETTLNTTFRPAIVPTHHIAAFFDAL